MNAWPLRAVAVVECVTNVLTFGVVLIFLDGKQIAWCIANSWLLPLHPPIMCLLDCRHSFIPKIPEELLKPSYLLLEPVRYTLAEILRLCRRPMVLPGPLVRSILQDLLGAVALCHDRNVVIKSLDAEKVGHAYFSSKKLWRRSLMLNYSYLLICQSLTKCMTLRPMLGHMYGTRSGGPGRVQLCQNIAWMLLPDLLFYTVRLPYGCRDASISVLCVSCSTFCII